MKRKGIFIFLLSITLVGCVKQNVEVVKVKNEEEAIKVVDVVNKTSLKKEELYLSYKKFVDRLFSNLDKIVKNYENESIQIKVKKDVERKSLEDEVLKSTLSY